MYQPAVVLNDLKDLSSSSLAVHTSSQSHTNSHTCAHTHLQTLIKSRQTWCLEPCVCVCIYHMVSDKSDRIMDVSLNVVPFTSIHPTDWEVLGYPRACLITHPAISGTSITDVVPRYAPQSCFATTEWRPPVCYLVSFFEVKRSPTCCTDYFIDFLFFFLLISVCCWYFSQTVTSFYYLDLSH